jgi:hypothetical protein
MLPSSKGSEPTLPTPAPSEFDLTHIRHAILQAKIGLSEGGVPIGAALARGVYTKLAIAIESRHRSPLREPSSVWAGTEGYNREARFATGRSVIPFRIVSDM